MVSYWGMPWGQVDGGWNSQSHRHYTVLQLRNGCHIHFSQQRKPLHVIQTHTYAGRQRWWESKCVCVAKTLLLFRDYTFNLGMRKWLQANNWAPWCLQRQNINSLCSATHWVKELIDTKTVLDMKWAKWRQYCCALVVVLVCNTRRIFLGLHIWVFTIIFTMTGTLERRLRLT